MQNTERLRHYSSDVETAHSLDGDFESVINNTEYQSSDGDVKSFHDVLVSDLVCNEPGSFVSLEPPVSKRITFSCPRQANIPLDPRGHHREGPQHYHRHCRWRSRGRFLNR